MRILSSIIQNLPDSLWLLTLLSVVVVKYVFPIGKKTKEDKQPKEDIIDCYHILSRRLYVTSETFQIVPDQEAEEIWRQRNSLIKIRWVSGDEGIYADLWNSGEKTIVYGNMYKRP